jgi:hypothetical protein
MNQREKDELILDLHVWHDELKGFLMGMSEPYARAYLLNNLEHLFDVAWRSVVPSAEARASSNPSPESASVSSVGDTVSGDK